jgi:hypothetical protein
LKKQSHAGNFYFYKFFIKYNTLFRFIE